MKENRKIDGIGDIVEVATDAAIPALLSGIFGDEVGEVVGSVVGNIPQVAIVKALCNIVSYAKEEMLKRKFDKFFETLDVNDFDLAEFNSLSMEKQQKIRLLIVATIEKQTDEIQAEALAYLVNAYVENKMTQDIFSGVANELEDINPLVFDFDSEWSKYNIDYTRGKISGCTAYLPRAFCSNTNVKLAFSSDEYLTPAGKAFFQCVYEPMKNKEKNKTL